MIKLQNYVMKFEILQEYCFQFVLHSVLAIFSLAFFHPLFCFCPFFLLVTDT